jgi:cell division protein ZapE
MDLTTIYRDKLADGTLKPDPGQAEVLRHLDVLSRSLAIKSNSTNPSFWSSIFGAKNISPPKGLYIHGAVGRGKTMLMDMFFVEVEIQPKQRIHFHAFMQSVHQKRAKLKTGDVISQIAADIAKSAQLLCLDEMQITDIADAMIIGRLFEALQGHGVCIVTTSNLAPQDLYRDGLNRQLFLPFIARIESSMAVVSLDSDKDYRLGRIKGRDSYIYPAGPATDAKFEKLWSDLTDGATGECLELSVLGRTLKIPRAAKSCARFTFAELCEQPLGAADYLALSAAYTTIFVEHVPKLKSSDRNAAKRFILLIDTLYDSKTKFVASAATPPEGIYHAGDHHFEFSRTLSRLKEMQSASWWNGKIAET